jgi:transposase InsO family protein
VISARASPVPNFTHLLSLADRRRLLEHARYSHPSPEHGYCLDDVYPALGDCRQYAAMQLTAILLALSDNGPQMTSGSSREFMVLCAIAQHFGWPHTPTHQAWIESLNGHLKPEYPHLLAIRDPATLRAELTITRMHYNSVRLHQDVAR